MNLRIAVRRMVTAAEQGDRRQFGSVMSTETATEPEGSLQTTIEPDSQCCQPTRVRCLLTLEPNGSLSCLAPVELT